MTQGQKEPRKTNNNNIVNTYWSVHTNNCNYNNGSRGEATKQT